MIVRFMDMHSGGELKTPYSHIYIEADSYEEALDIFKEKFDRNPYNVTCNCCGEDFSVSEEKDLKSATGYERGCQWAHDIGGYDDRSAKISLEEYLASEDVLFIGDTP